MKITQTDKTHDDYPVMGHIENIFYHHIQTGVYNYGIVPDTLHKNANRGATVNILIDYEQKRIVAERCFSNGKIAINRYKF